MTAQTKLGSALLIANEENRKLRAALERAGEMSIASPQNDEERRIAQISDDAYEMGWQEGREEQQAEVARLRAEIEEWKDETNYYQAEARKLRAAAQVIRNMLDVDKSVPIEDAVNRLLADRNRLRAALEMRDHYYHAEARKLRTALERAEKLFDAIAMRDQNGHALDGANEIRAALANE